MSKSFALPVLALLLAATGASAGCGDAKDGPAGTGGSSSTGGSGAEPCPNLAGTWTVSAHCQTALVGSTVRVSQTGCMFKDETYGFTGTLSSDGTLTVSSGPMNATCTGTASASAVTENCTVAGQPCSVSLVR